MNPLYYTVCGFMMGFGIAGYLAKNNHMTWCKNYELHESQADDTRA